MRTEANEAIEWVTDWQQPRKSDRRRPRGIRPLPFSSGECENQTVDQRRKTGRNGGPSCNLSFIHQVSLSQPPASSLEEDQEEGRGKSGSGLSLIHPVHPGNRKTLRKYSREGRKNRARNPHGRRSAAETATKCDGHERHVPAGILCHRRRRLRRSPLNLKAVKNLTRVQCLSVPIGHKLRRTRPRGKGRDRY